MDDKTKDILAELSTESLLFVDSSSRRLIRANDKNVNL